MKKQIWLTAAGCAVIALVSYGGFHLYKRHVFRTKISEALAKDAAYSETVLKVESDDPKITYKELFELCDKSIIQRRDLIIQLRSDQTVSGPVRDQIVDYFNAENGMTRTKRDYYQKQLDFQSKLDSYNAYEQRRKELRAQGDFLSGTQQTIETMKREVSLIDASQELILEQLSYHNVVAVAAVAMEESAKAYSDAFSDSLKQEQRIASFVRASGVEFTPVLSKYEKSLSRVEDSRKAAKAFLKS